MKRTLAFVLLLTLVAGACTSDRTTTGSEESNDEGGAAAARGDFGSLKDVCQSGTAKAASAQGVTAKGIEVGVLTDFGFTKEREFIDTAEVFTKWCNAAGGINGRPVTFTVRDTNLFEYRQRIIEACQEDFMVVGGGAAFDNTGVRDRLKCLLPEIPAQPVSYENDGSGLQVNPISSSREYAPYESYFRWLLTKAHPGSEDAVGIVAGDVGITRLFSQRETETLQFLGAKVIYNDFYPATGVADWTPYAQAIKSKGVKGLVFLGQYNELAKLEQALVDVGHKLTWIDANTNSNNPEFIKLTGKALEVQKNYSAPYMFPPEEAADNAATKELVDLFKRYAANNAGPTGPGIQAFSAWLLFATAARDCEDDVTRSCVLEKAAAQTKWDGGGLHAVYDLTAKESPRYCQVILGATTAGWRLADFGPNEGEFLCADHQHKLQGEYPDAVQLEDVGRSPADLK